MSRYQKDQGVTDQTSKVAKQDPQPNQTQQGKQPVKAQPAQGQSNTKTANNNQRPNNDDVGGKQPGKSQPPQQQKQQPQQQQQQQQKLAGSQKSVSKNQQTGYEEKDAYTPRTARDDVALDPQSEKEKQESAKKEEMEARTKAYYDHLQQEMVVEQLRKATRMRNRLQLERLIVRFEDLHITDRDEDLHAAKSMVDVLNCRERLVLAMKNKVIANIEQSLQEIEDRDYVPYLQPEVQQAEHMLFVLVKAEERANKSVPTLDAVTLSEVRAYKHPPTHVHRVVQAVLLLLGEHEGRTEDWKECQKLCAPQGQNSISRRMYDFETETLKPEIAARVKQILSKVDLQKMQETSTGVTAYYVWAKGTVDEYERENDTEGVKPATKSRQRELLPDSPLDSPRKWNVVGDRR